MISQLDEHTKFTLRQDNMFFGLWNILIIFNEVYSAIAYPYFTVNDFPNFSHVSLWVIFISEFIFLINIVLSFFKQDLDEEGETKHDSLSQIANRYFKNQFTKDFIAFVPFGYLLSLYDKRLKFFWVIKTIRITSLNY